MPQTAAPGLSSLFGSSPSFAPERPPNSEPPRSGTPRLAEISRLVDQVVASWQASVGLAEHRGWQRVRYKRPAVLTPLDDRTGTGVGPHKIISGRDISPSGFSFTHLDPLPCRQAIITFAFEEELRDAVVLRLSWCRFTREGIYQSGGKFSNVVASLLPAEQLLDDLPYA